MKSRKLYISDLDGTLLNAKGELSEESFDILKELIEQGVLFTVASARPIVAIKRILKDLPITLPVISTNGAYVSDYGSLNHIRINNMSQSAAAELVALSNKLGLNAFVSTYTDFGDKTYWNRFDNKGQQKFVEERIANKDPRLTKTSDITQEINSPVVMFMILDERYALERFVCSLSAEVKDSLDIHINDDVYDKDYCWLVVTDKKAMKHEAILTLVELQKLHDCEIVVFGDQTNDISMMEIAHESVAVSNAVDAVKAVATKVIGANTDNSVALYIKQDSAGINWRK